MGEKRDRWQSSLGSSFIDPRMYKGSQRKAAKTQNRIAMRRQGRGADLSAPGVMGRIENRADIRTGRRVGRRGYLREQGVKRGQATEAQRQYARDYMRGLNDGSQMPTGSQQNTDVPTDFGGNVPPPDQGAPPPGDSNTNPNIVDPNANDKTQQNYSAMKSGGQIAPPPTPNAPPGGMGGKETPRQAMAPQQGFIGNQGFRPMGGK